MSIEIRIVCDNCRRVESRYGYGRGWVKSGAKAHLLRKHLKDRLAWKVGLRNGRDLCYHCALAETQEEKGRHD